MCSQWNRGPSFFMNGEWICSSNDLKKGEKNDWKWFIIICDCWGYLFYSSTRITIPILRFKKIN